MKLDLASGPTTITEEHIGVDLIGGCALGEAEPGDVAHLDLQELPWPWATSTVDEVFCAHYIQFLTNPGWTALVDEVWRILKPGGLAKFVWPQMRTGRAFQDPRIRSVIPLERFSFASRKWRAAHAGPDPLGELPACDFELVDFGWLGLHDDQQDRNEEAKKFSSAHYWDFAADAHVLLRCLKEET